MKPERDPLLLIHRTADLLGQPVAAWQRAPHGADHLVLLVTLQDGQRVVAKAGAEAYVDAYVLDRLRAAHDKVPTVLAHAPLDHGGEAASLLVMSAIDAPLLADAAGPLWRYLPSLVTEMQRVYRITTTAGAGPAMEVVAGTHWTWREHLSRVLTGEDAEFHWSEIWRDRRLDQHVLMAGIDWLTARVKRLAEPAHLSLLHGDLNPYNILVDGHDVVGIIDWSYARFGDPLFDFARLRMNPFIRAHPPAIDRYFELLRLSPSGREREHIYYVFHLLEYVNWYYQDHQLDRVQEQLTLIGREIHASGCSGAK